MKKYAEFRFLRYIKQKFKNRKWYIHLFLRNKTHVSVEAYLYMHASFLKGSNSWWPWKWVTSTVPCPLLPCSAPIDSYPWLLLWIQFTSCLVFFSCCLLFIQTLTSFPKNSPSYDVSEVGQLRLSFLPSAMLHAYLFVFLVVQGILQHHISNKSTFSYQPSSLIEEKRDKVIVRQAF